MRFNSGRKNKSNVFIEPGSIRERPVPSEPMPHIDRASDQAAAAHPGRSCSHDAHLMITSWHFGENPHILVINIWGFSLYFFHFLLIKWKIWSENCFFCTGFFRPYSTTKALRSLLMGLWPTVNWKDTLKRMIWLLSHSQWSVNVGL